MNFIKSIFIMLISLLLLPLISLDVSASSSFGNIETQIHAGSSKQKVTKLQTFLKEIGIYKGVVDGNFKSIERTLLDYQKKSGIIKNDDDYGAGYFGKKTLTAIKKDYPSVFTKKSQKILKVDKPIAGKKYFYITAYYSPLPGQKKYTTGSYRGDIRLNGEGKRTASGKPVFEGLLAGPRNYSFGTKIRFDGLGVGVVEDRGGAIVNAGERGHEYDRIDVWMGYGDEGLRRALNWGTRKVQGEIVSKGTNLTMSFGVGKVSKYANLKVDAEKPKKENVEKLQNLLTDVKLYNGPINGDFNKIKDILVKYQVENNIIKSKNDENAGYFGNKTFASMRRTFGEEIFKTTKKADNKDDNNEISSVIKLKMDKLALKISNIINKKYGKNTLAGKQYRKKIKILLSNHTKKIKNKARKQQLVYLNSIIK